MNLSYWWNLGSLLLLLVMLQISSGVLLTFYYDNSHLNFLSTFVLHLETFLGYNMHIIHLNGASLIFMVLYFHIFKGILLASFCKMKLVWLSGVTLLFFMMLTAFLGYVLPWGQMSLWGATVITNLITVLPKGKLIVDWVWGGFFVSNYTVKFFYSLHFITPLVMLVFITFHLVSLHFKGSSNPLGLDSPLIKAEFIPHYLAKDSLNFVILGASYTFILLNPYYSSDSENFNIANPMMSPVHIKPEWYFLQYYAVLRSVPNKSGGVVFFISSLLILFFICLKSSYLNLASLKIWKIFSFFFLCTNLVLIWLGNCPVELPFSTLGMLLSICYFTLVGKMLFFISLINPKS